jgi:hypothetical protein
MKSRTLLHPAALLPIAMSLTALGIVLVHAARFGTAPQPDEGTSAHLWQLLMAGQIPIIGWFLVTRLPDGRPSRVAVIALQLASAFAAALPVWWWHW